MSIWNKILIGFIFIASVAFFYLSTRALKTHMYWRDIAHKHEKALAQEQERRTTLLEGPKAAGKEAELGIREAIVQLHKVMVDRGRVWRGVTRQQVDVAKDAKTGKDEVKVVVEVPLPDPHRIEQGASLVLFDEKNVEEKGSYLGRFVVEAVNAKQLQLKAGLRLTDRDIKRLKDSDGKWSIYEITPIDDHDIFADCPDLDKLIPDASREEYAKDGKPTDPNNKESAKFERRLRDYESLFTLYHHQESYWLEKMEATTRDKQYIETGLESAKKEVEGCQKNVAQLKQEVAKITRERDAVAAHRKAVEASFAAVSNNLKQTLAKNRELTGEIARIQLEATRRIDARSGKVAQVNLGN
jgi:hypothetical protein